MTWFGLPEVFLCCQKIAAVLLHRCQHAQVALHSAVVVVGDIILNHLYEFLSACKTLAIISLSFQNAPKTFHWSVVNALGYSGHTLLHFGVLQLVVEYSVGVLESSVAME